MCTTTAFTFMCFLLLCGKHLIIAQQNNARFTPVLNLTQCEGQTTCENVFNYPDDHISRILSEKLSKFNYVLREDIIDFNVSSRVFNVEKTLCESTPQLEEPKAGLNKDDVWMFLVNHGEYKQAVEVRRCKNENQPCNLHEHFPVKTECRQKYFLRNMLALDPANGELKEENIKLPSCCVCHYFKPKNK